MHIEMKEHRKLPVEALKLCMQYQRTQNERHVQKIVDAWNEDAFGALVVARRKDGSLWVVDGGHRLAAARALKINTVPCTIMDSDGPAHEALVFRALSTTRKVHIITVFWGRITAGEKVAVDILRTVRSHGFEIPKSTGGANRGEGRAVWPRISAVGALERCANECGLDGLDTLLSVIKRAWNNDDQALSMNILNGLSMWLRVTEKPDVERLVLVLKSKVAANVLAAAKILVDRRRASAGIVVMGNSNGRDGMRGAVCEVIDRLYRGKSRVIAAKKKAD